MHTLRRHKVQIGNVIIGFIAVTMMHHFASLKWPTEMLFHHDAVFQSLLTSPHIQQDIPVAVMRSSFLPPRVERAAPGPTEA